MRRRRGFTMIEIMVTLAVMAIVLAVAVPALTPSSRTRLVGAANLFIADLNNARALSVQNPGDPVRVVLAAGGEGYFLALTSAPTEPMELPLGVGGKYAVVFGEGDSAALWEVTVAPHGVAPSSIVDGSLPKIVFDAFGRLSPATDVRLDISSGGDTLTVLIRADTGDAFLE